MLEAHALRALGDAPVVLPPHRVRRLGEVRALRPREVEHGDEEARPEADHALDAERERPRHVAAEPAVLVPVLLQAGRSAHDGTEQLLAVPALDASGIARRDRREDEGRRAERIVLVTVLDVDDALAVEEPRLELDVLADARARLLGGRARDELAKVFLQRVPVELDVVVAVQHRERVAVGDELAELVEHLGVTRGDATQLEPRVILGAADAVATLLGRQLGLERLVVPRVDRHADEVDEVSGDHDPPAMRAGRLVGAIVRQHPREIPVDRGRAGDVRSRVVEVTAEMHVGEDEDAFRRLLRGAQARSLPRSGLRAKPCLNPRFCLFRGVFPFRKRCHASTFQAPTSTTRPHSTSGRVGRAQREHP